jgi:uncharacterized protein (TIGR02217 family)
LQADSRRRYEISLSHVSDTEYRSIIKHHNARRGRTHSFPHNDLMFNSVTSEPFGTGGGIGSTNQLVLNEGDASNAYNREIYLPVAGFQVRANGNLKFLTTDYTVGTGANSGLITWVTSVSGQTLTWTGSFYEPVRYDTDEIASLEMIALLGTRGVIKGTTISLVEVDYVSEWI